MRLLSFIGSRRNETRSPTLDRDLLNIEIVLPVQLTGVLKQETRVNKKSGILKRNPSNIKSGILAGIKRSASDSTRSMTIFSANITHDDATCDGWSKYSLGCRRKRSVKHCLWNSTSDSNGHIKLMDNLCRDQVVHMMSRNDAARKKMLDDILNHGEF